MVEKTQGINTEGEGVIPAPPEKVEPTQPKEKSTEKTYKEADFQKAVSKGLESITRQLDLQKSAANTAKAEAEQYKAEMEVINAELKELQTDYDSLAEQQYSDDPDAKKAFLSRKTIAEERRKLAKRSLEVERKLLKAQTLESNFKLATRARELMQETGVPLEEIENCKTEEDMEVKALRYQLSYKAKEPEEPEKEEKPSKFDSNLPSGGGGKTYKNSELPAIEARINAMPHGAERRAAQQDLRKAFAEGRVLNE